MNINCITMRKSIVLTVIFFAAIYFCNAQGKAPGMKWQRWLGGSSADILTFPRKSALVDRDGQYIIGGNSNSIDGDVTGNHPSPFGSTTKDIWVVKLDSQRNILWNVSLGGPGADEIGSLQLAHDSGYIITGIAGSNGGDVSGIHGAYDAWVVRLGTRGNVVWQKCLGGSNSDMGSCIALTKDGYIVVGVTASTDGDVKGRHGAFNNEDIWVVKLSKSGNIIWQKCLGGSGEDHPSGIKQTADGGYILSGTTSSNDGDVQGQHGVDDIWVVKLTSGGAIEWQKCLGGTNYDFAWDIEQTATGSYLVAGMTWSYDGDVTGNHKPTPKSPTDSAATDAWVISLTSTGNLEWQKCFGGSDNDAFHDLLVKPDKTVVAVGEAYSNDGDVSSVRSSGTGCWMVNFNSTNGNIIWEKIFGTSNADQGVTLSLKNNDNMVIGGFSFGANRYYDLWLLEVGSTNTIAGYAFYDANSDGVKNNGESFFDGITIKAGKNGDTISAIPRNGYYSIDVDTGTYSIKAVPYNNYYTIAPAVQTSTFNSYFNTDSIHFAVQPLPNILDVTVSILPLTVVRPGFAAQYKIVYKNVGTNTVTTGSIKLVKDSRLSLTSALPAASAVNGDNLTWNYNNLAPNTEASITLDFVVAAPPATNIGDTLKSKVYIEPGGTDITPNDDTAILKQIVIGSYDPNDKTETHGGVISPEQISGADPLTYLIRFQNTGTDTAFNITVRDTLDNRLDWNSLQMIASSHSYLLSVEDGNQLTWQFNNIKLPYTGIDEPGSHGYIAYRIKPKTNVSVGDTIRNTAGIYFDYNLPIATNTEKTVVFLLTPLPVTLTSFQAALDGTDVNVTWTTSIEDHVKHFEVQRSINGFDFITIGIVNPGQKTYHFKDRHPVKGYNYYRLKSVDADGAVSYSTIVLVNLKSDIDVISSLYPNPATGNITLKLQGAVEGNVLLQVLDQQGRLVTSRQFGVQHTGEFKTPLDLGRLPKGSYMLRIMVNEKTYLNKLLIQ